MRIAIFDTNVLIYLFDELPIVSSIFFHKVMQYLQTRFFEIWFPQSVEYEFTIPKHRLRCLKKLLNNFHFLQRCKINVSRNEIRLLLPEIDLGEADAIIQIQKGVLKFKKGLQVEFIFVSEDRAALRKAKEFNIETLDYKDLKEELRELGIEF